MDSTTVSRNWIKHFVETQPRHRVEEMVGRALVALFRRQTREEQNSNHTHNHNVIGFSSADGKSGSITAKTYLKNKRLLDWQLAKWTNPTRNGYPRIAKYARQLSEIADEKALRNGTHAYRAASRAG